MREVTRYFFDTEFMEDGVTIKPLSLGIVAEDGRELYATLIDVDHGNANSFVREHVIPNLAPHDSIRTTRPKLAKLLQVFVEHGQYRPEFWTYYGAYDWIVMCQLFGTMMQLPRSWPMFSMDVKQLAVSMGDPKLPKQTNVEHNALDDAKWTRDSYLWLMDGEVRSGRS